MFLIVLEICVALLLLAFFATQVGVPFIRGTPFFPTFRPKTPLKVKTIKAEKALVETTELVNTTRQLKKVTAQKAKLEKK